MKPTTINLFVIGLIMFGASYAWADVPAPDGYEETCTLEQQHNNDEDCLECDVNMSQQDEEYEGKCTPDAYTADGYEYVCQTRGGTFHNEIWCKDAPGAIGPAGDESDTGCSVTNVGAQPVAGSVFLVGIVFALIVWRRRRN